MSKRTTDKPARMISQQDALVPMSPTTAIKLKDISAVAYGQDPVKLSRFVEILLNNGEKISFGFPNEEIQHEFYKVVIATASGMMPPIDFTKFFMERFIQFVPSAVRLDPEEETNE